MNTTTKKGKGFTQLSKPLVAAAVIGIGGLVFALTDAGTVIKNLATVTYEDATGEEYIATSNEAQVTVAEVFAAILTTDQTVQGQVGDTVNLPHTITNTGNSSDTYTIATATVLGGAATVGSTTVFVDTNGNGQVDPGEPTLAALGNVTPALASGESLQLIVAVEVTAGADADTIETRLTAVSAGGNQLLDDEIPDPNSAQPLLGLGGAEDGNNLDIITLTSGAIIQATKSSQFLDADTLEYVLTVENTGGAAVTNAQIFDAFPAGTSIGTFQIQSVTGLTGTDELYGDGNAYSVLGATFPLAVGIGLATDLDEPTGIDMNGNGVTAETNVNGFLLRDDSLAAGATISVTYTIDISSGDIFRNIFCAGTGITDAAALDLTATPNECSNQTIDRVAPVFAVQITDTRDTTLDATADSTGGAGDDADGVDNDVQFVAEAGMTEVVEYRLYIRNNSNREDFLDLALENDGTFPAGTVFTFFNQSGNVPLVDNNNNGTVDAGLFQPGEDAIIVVKAQLPVAITPANITEIIIPEIGVTLAEGDAALVLESGDYFLDVVEDGVHVVAGVDGFIGNGPGTEFIDGSGPQLNDSEVFSAVISITSEGGGSIVSDRAVIALGKIVAHRLDLANSSAASAVPDFTDADLNAHDGLSTAPIITVGNDDFADNFDENGTDDQSPVNSGNGLGDGEVIRGDTVIFPLFVVNNGSVSDTFDLTLDAATAALTEFTIDIQSTGGATITDTGVLAPGQVFEYQVEVVVGAAAANGEQVFGFVATSAASSATATPATTLTDTVFDAIIVEVAQCVIQVSGAAPLELAAGATVDFTHTVTNSYNLPVTYTFSSVITEFEAPGWTTTLFEDDGVTPLTPQLVAANASVTFIQRLTAPAGASIAETAVGTVTIDADDVLCLDEEVIDEATITIDGVQITKQVALDTGCDCVADAAFSLDAGTQLPGACVVWLLEATNSSGAAVDNVVVRDPLSQFTEFHANGIYDLSLPGYTGTAGIPVVTNAFQSCTGAPTCTLSDVTDGGAASANGGTLAITADEVAFDFGTLANGDIARGSFCAQIQ